MNRLFVPILLAASLLAASLLGAAQAQAHAMLDHASPLVGSTASAPRAVTLWFTQKLEGAFSTIEVRDAGGARVDAGKAQVDKGNATVLRVGLKPLKPGTYQVHWRVLSVDTHTTEGNFSFSVGP
jgi:methionine-rich copper-binding protein CopC